MSGRHESPSKRSFYFSLATSTLRFAIIVALVVGGVVVINSAFTDSGGGGPGPGGGALSGPTAPTGPTAATGPTGPTGQGQQEEPQIVDMNVAVRNGTGVSGLAGDTAAALEDKYGVNAIQIDDAPQTVSITTIYYRGADSQDEAEFLARKFFKAIEPEVAKLEAGSGVDKDVEIAIYLGTDYASSD